MYHLFVVVSFRLFLKVVKNVRFIFFHSAYNETVE